MATKALWNVRDGYAVVTLPPWGQVGPELEKLLNALPWYQANKMVNHWRLDYYDAETQKQYTQAARHICECWNTGKREYCKELLIPTKQRFKHG